MDSRSRGYADVEIFPLRYTVGDLAGVPEDDVVFFLMCGQLQNDLVILSRQVLQASINEDDPEPVRLAKSTAAHLNMRLLAGRLAEGWKLVKDRFQKVFADYSETISPSASADLKALRRYFGGPNLVRDLRDNVVSHYDQDVAREAYRGLTPEEPLIDLHARIEGNTIFFSGEVLMIASTVHLSGQVDPEEALTEISKSTLAISAQLGKVVRAYLQAFSRRHLRNQLDVLEKEKIVVPDQPRIDEFAVPVYLAAPYRLSPVQREMLSTSGLSRVWGFQQRQKWAAP